MDIIIGITITAEGRTWKFEFYSFNQTVFRSLCDFKCTSAKSIIERNCRSFTANDCYCLATLRFIFIRTLSATVYVPGFRSGILIFPLLSVTTVLSTPFSEIRNDIPLTLPSSAVFTIWQVPGISSFTALMVTSPSFVLLTVTFHCDWP